MKTILITFMLLTQIQGQQNDSTQIEAQEKILIGLTLADIATTGYIISTGGTELNPLLPDDNIPTIAVIKIVLLVVYLKTDPPKKQIWFMNFLTSTAVLNNFYQIIKHERRGK